MEDREKSVAEIVRVIARGNAAVAGTDADGERMRCAIEPAAMKIKSQGRRCCLAEGALPIQGVIAVRNRDIRLAARSGDRAYQRRQVVMQRGEERRNVTGLRGRFVLVQEGIVRRFRIAESFRFTAF